MSDLHWKTSITKIEANKISMRGYPVDELMGKISFTQGIYLVLKGKMPSDEEGKLLDAIFVSSIDHGSSPPSVLTARTVASTGSELNACVAGGVLAISRFHGGAIEEGMRLFLMIASRLKEKNSPVEEAAGCGSKRDEGKWEKSVRIRSSNSHAGSPHHKAVCHGRGIGSGGKTYHYCQGCGKGS
jgi:citrate synthase